MDGDAPWKSPWLSHRAWKTRQNTYDNVQYFSHISGTLLQRRVNLSREAGREDQRWQISVIRAAVSRRKSVWM